MGGAAGGTIVMSTGSTETPMQVSATNSATNSASANNSGMHTAYNSIDAPMGDEELIAWLKQFNIDQDTIDKVVITVLSKLNNNPYL